MWIFVLLLLIPFIEIALFVTVGGWLTLWPTLALVLASAVLGSTLIRWQGQQVRDALRTEMAAMQDPLAPMAHGALIFFAGVLLILPGFFTDTLGLLLLLPVVRRLVIRLIGDRIKGRMAFMARGPLQRGRNDPASDWVDAEFEEIAPERKDLRPPSGWTRH